MADASSLAHSEVLDWFGGDGAGGDGCVTAGPFANLELHLGSDYTTRPYCLARNITQARFDGAGASYVRACYSMPDFVDAWPCYEGYPHGAGHNGIGGVVSTASARASHGVSCLGRRRRRRRRRRLMEVSAGPCLDGQRSYCTRR